MKKLRLKHKPRPKKSARGAARSGAAPIPLTVVAGGKSVPKIPIDVLGRAKVPPRALHDLILRTVLPYTPLPGVLPKDQKPMAMDSAQTDAIVAWAQTSSGVYWSEGLVFMGYAELANLTIRPEYRVMSEIIATECTRKWISFEATDEEKESDEPILEANEDFPEQAKAGVGEEVDEDADADGETDETADAPDAAENDNAEPDDDKERVTGDAEPPPPPGQAPAADPAMQEGLARLQEAKQEQAEAKAAMAKERAAALAQEDGKADRIKELEKEMDRLCVRDLFSKLVEFDGYFGRAHIYIDTGQGNSREELITDIGTGSDEVTRQKFKKGSLKRLKIVEPIWTYPQSYNSIDPLSEDWYSPTQWFVMGKQLHCSRLLTLVGRPVPDMLKPAYAFGGLSLSQLAKTYIDNWLGTRKSVNDIIRAFSVMVLQTDMTARMQNGGDDLFNRIDLFNALRDNRGTFVLDKEAEDFKNVSAPLSSLDQLQAQAQEHMAAVSRIPLVKLLGISPHGLNASSEGELKTFYDTINSYQESRLRPLLTRIVHFAMMNIWGEIDEDITFKFETLWALTEKEEAEVRKIEAETDDILVNGVAALHPEEVRKRIATDPSTPYQGIDVADIPEAPIEDTLSTGGHKAFGEGAQAEEDGEGEEDKAGKLFHVKQSGAQEDDPGLTRPPGPGPGGGRLSRRPGGPAAQDAWSESDHPRVSGGPGGGQFTSGGGGGGSGEAEGGKGTKAEQVLKAAAANIKAIAGGSPELAQAEAPPQLWAEQKFIVAKEHGLSLEEATALLSPEEHGELSGSEYGSPEGLWDWVNEEAEQPTTPSQSEIAAKSEGGAAYAGQYVTTGSSPKENHALTVSKVLGSATQKGIHYRRMLAKLIKEAPGFGGASAVAPLKEKLGEALVMTHSTLIKNGKTAEADKVAKTLAKMGLLLSEPAEPQAAPAKPKTPQIAAPAGSTPLGAKPAAAKITVSTADMEKAKKPSAFYPVPTTQAGKNIAAEFNAKYEGKTLTDPAALQQKVIDYSEIKQKIAKVEEDAQKKAQADAEKKAIQQVEKQKEEAKKQAVANKQVMADLGINEQEAVGFNALAQMMGGNKADVVSTFKKYEDQAKALGYPITGFQAALIKNYSGSGYAHINPHLRSGSWTEAQHVYVKMVNKALKQMPTFKGVCRRGTSLTPEQQQPYKVGHIVPQNAFMSTTSTGKGFSGNTSYVVTAIGKRGASIQNLSSHPSEGEVLFAARTYFKITKVEGAVGQHMTVHMEEMDDD